MPLTVVLYGRNKQRHARARSRAAQGHAQNDQPAMSVALAKRSGLGLQLGKGAGATSTRVTISGVTVGDRHLPLALSLFQQLVLVQKHKLVVDSGWTMRCY
jgi:hypothetical protein